MADITVTPTDMAELLEVCVRAGVTAFLKGSPSTAKSSIVQQVAKRLNLKLIDIRLSQCEPPDLLGFPRINPETGKSEYAPMVTFPLESDPLPVDANGVEMNGWMIFFDEFNGADIGTQKASYKVILDHYHGDFKMHPNVAKCAAGNLETDKALVATLSSAMKSRILHFSITPDIAGFLEFARVEGFSHEIVSFLEFKPSSYYTFNPATVDGVDTYACNRTWHFLDSVYKKMPDAATNRLALPLFAGCLGEGVAREFLVYLKNFSKLPKIADILSNPADAKLPKEPSTQYAITGAIGQNATPDNMAKLITYVTRLPLDFQVVTLRNIIKSKKMGGTSMVNHPAIQDWMGAHGDLLF
jgi:hypothetical protein